MSATFAPPRPTATSLDPAVILGGVLESVVALACIDTAAALCPGVKRQNEDVAMGLVGARVLEAAAIFAGVVRSRTIVNLRQAGVRADGLATGQAPVAQYPVSAASSSS